LLAILSFLRNYGAIPDHVPIEWDRAHVYTVKADKDSLYQAAHSLPCQLVINRALVWNLVSGEDIEAQHITLELRKLFADELIAPKVFNSADSLAEESCLRGALLDACADVIAASKPILRRAGVLKTGPAGEILLTTRDVENPTAGIDFAATENAFKTWLVQSRAAFCRAIEAAKANGVTVLGKDGTRDVIEILEGYLSESLSAEAPSREICSRMEQNFWRARKPPSGPA
jgi:hypothetical protein